MPASKNALTTLSAEALVPIGAPVASGATLWTASANRRSEASYSPPVRGRTWMRAQPSLAIQSATSWCGKLPSVMGRACSIARI